MTSCCHCALFLLQANVQMKEQLLPAFQPNQQWNSMTNCELQQLMLDVLQKSSSPHDNQILWWTAAEYNVSNKGRYKEELAAFPSNTTTWYCCYSVFLLQPKVQIKHLLLPASRPKQYLKDDLKATATLLLLLLSYVAAILCSTHQKSNKFKNYYCFDVRIISTLACY